jgi:hypothetical protein
MRELSKSEYITSSEKQEQQSHVNTGDNFYDGLCESVKFDNDNIEALTRTNPFFNRGFVAVIQAEFQADAALAHRAVNKLSGVIISADTDLVVLVGPSCCLVKQYKYSQRQNKADPMYNIDMTFSSIIVLNNLLHNIDQPVIPKNYQIKASIFRINCGSKN